MIDLRENSSGDPLPFEADPEREEMAAEIRTHLALQKLARENAEMERKG